MQSSFLTTGTATKEADFAILHLSRDQQLPIELSNNASKIEDQGYAEGRVTNTKFGSFPHSTLIGIPWGSQVLASKVDTGSRGRGDRGQGRKRKAEAISGDVREDTLQNPAVKQATAATSGFIHVLPPTPESWTTSLPHRTQVVYTPDYSYILQRIRARPGSTVVEAGSGSGSFTHAAARAVFAPYLHEAKVTASFEPGGTRGKVFTYEFHAERHEKVKKEMLEHRLGDIVTATHQDVYKKGFWINDQHSSCISPRANSIFLDLPAPWEALPHLTRNDEPGKPSALDPDSPVHICTFSPCIEQVQKTVTEMRKLGWLEIEMVEIQHKRIEVRREYIGLKYEGMRAADPVAANVEEALSRLHEVERNAQHQQSEKKKGPKGTDRMQEAKQQSAAQVYWDEGQLVHRSEPELKLHTSYLAFAVLPRVWTEEHDEAARAEVASISAAVSRSPKALKKMKSGIGFHKQTQVAKNGQSSDA